MNIVAALYKFSLIKEPNLLQLKIRNKFKSYSVCGTILIGNEGLNGTISGNKSSIIKAIKYIKSIEGFNNIDIKYSESQKNPSTTQEADFICHQTSYLTSG